MKAALLLALLALSGLGCGGGSGCCVTCKTGCGNSCISCSDTCHAGAGCACNAEKTEQK